MVLRRVIVSSLAGALASACAAPVAGPATPSAAPRDAGLDALVKAARADAAQRTGVAAESLVLVSADSVTWSDGSLGCPQPGVMYTQALVPGFRIVLRGPAGELDYHASARGALVLCPAGRAMPPVPGAARY